jgi:hypothetical protein
MKTSKLLKKLLFLLFLSFTGSSYPHKPVSAHTHTGDATELLGKLRARPEYRELAEHFSLVTNPHTRAGKNAPTKIRRQALISCMATLEKLEETYPSELLNQVASWCYTQLKKTNRTKKWIRNGLIIGGSALALAAALVAAKYWKEKQYLKHFNSLSYQEKLQRSITNRKKHQDYYDEAIKLRKAYRNPSSPQDDLESALAEALLNEPVDTQLIQIIRNLLPQESQQKVDDSVQTIKERYPTPEKQKIYSDLFASRFQILKHKEQIKNIEQTLQKSSDSETITALQTHITGLKEALAQFKEEERNLLGQLQAST